MPSDRCRWNLSNWITTASVQLVSCLLRYPHLPNPKFSKSWKSLTLNCYQTFQSLSEEEAKLGAKNIQFRRIKRHGSLTAGRQRKLLECGGCNKTLNRSFILSSQSSFQGVWTGRLMRELKNKCHESHPTRAVSIPGESEWQVNSFFFTKTEL